VAFQVVSHLPRISEQRRGKDERVEIDQTRSVRSYPVGMDAEDREAFRQHDRPVATSIWIAILAICVACGWGLGLLWSFGVSVPLMAVLALAGLELHLRWAKQRWIRRFPELSDPATRWRRWDGL
jgi:hypothetical protein